MTEEPMLNPMLGDGAHAAVMLGEQNLADREFLDLLRGRADVAVIDRGEFLRAELQELLPVLTAVELAAPTQWAWYPWRRTLVAVLAPHLFRRLRLDRNRNKITLAEQGAFARLRIGVVGLSVGHAIAHTLALEGLCGQLRLADNDTIELSNLNRIPATIFDLGVNKAVVLSRRIAELDPYLVTEVFTTGLTEECMAEFFDGLDIVVEECDSLDMKLRVREEAKKRGIPVLMETSDRGLFDVERFDLEPHRELFHGLLGTIDAQSLQGLSTHDKAPHVMRILQTDGLSPRMAASMVEIDRTVSTWPQLAGDVQLGGATVAAAVRRLGRGEDLKSGRIRVDLDQALDTLDDYAGAVADGGPAPVKIDLTAEVPVRPLEAVVHAIRLAPSGGNVQPWALRSTPAGFDIHLVPERSSAMDVRFRGSYVSIGAAAYNARVAADHHGLHAAVTAMPGPDPHLIVSIALSAGHDPDLLGLYRPMINRISNRNYGSSRPLSTSNTACLYEAARLAGADLQLVMEPARIAQLADVLAESDRIRYLTPLLHQQMMGEMRWPGPDRAADGIDVHCLGLDAADLAKLAVTSRADVLTELASWGLGAALGDNTRDRVNASSAVAIITIGGDSPQAYVRGGMALEQLWLRAEQQGLAVHPVSPVFLYARNPRDLEDLSPGFSTELGALQRRFAEITGITADQAPVLVLRLSHDVPQATARSQRLDLAAVLEQAPGVTLNNANSSAIAAGSIDGADRSHQ